MYAHVLRQGMKPLGLNRPGFTHLIDHLFSHSKIILYRAHFFLISTTFFFLFFFILTLDTIRGYTVSFSAKTPKINFLTA